jgi:hypothetical protein
MRKTVVLQGVCGVGPLRVHPVDTVRACAAAVLPDHKGKDQHGACDTTDSEAADR